MAFKTSHYVTETIKYNQCEPILLLPHLTVFHVSLFLRACDPRVHSSSLEQVDFN